jgi:hypothetical protein
MKALFATAAVVASIAAAPTALGSNFVTENSASQNRLHQPQSSSGFITENSATQNRVDRAQNRTLGAYPPTGYAQHASASAQAAVQNRIGQLQAQSGSGFITDNSATQNRIQQPAIVTVAAPGGFHWGDAGIGAAGGVGAMLLLLGGAVVVARKRQRSPLAA